MVGVSSETRRGTGRGFGGGSFINSFLELGFKGRIYPVNPKADEIMGLKSYPTVSAIPEPVDLVVVSVPARALPGVLEDCAAADARNIHVFTSGFEETGEPERIELGRRVREIAAREQLRIIGPNCMGLYVPRAGIGTFDHLPRQSGPVAFVSQSGGHCNWYTHNGPDYGVHFSKAISFGNAYVLDSTDYLEYLAGDPETDIICMYLEGVKDGRKLLKQVLSQFQKLSWRSDDEDIMSPLTPREIEILEHIAKGLLNKQIAAKLGISEQTIKNHVTSILRKLNANARTEAVVLAIKQGVISIS